MFGARNFFLTAARAVGDSLWNYVTALFSTTSTNGAQNNTFLDSSTNNFTITRNGNTTQGSFSPYEPTGYWSLYQAAVPSDYINFTTSPGALFEFTGDYTIEMWVFPVTLSSDTSLWVTSNSGVTLYHAFNIDATNYNIYLNSGTPTSSFSHGLNVNQWNHVALVRSGSTVTAYTNGASRGTITNSSTNGFSSPGIARTGGGAAGSSRYLSNLRIVKGTAVYTTAFTPPTAPLTAISGTSLLTCQSNRFVDNSSNALVATVTGSPSVQTFSPLGNTTPYSTAAVGGSGYFDGSGDYLQAASNAAFALSGDFTINAWIYPTSTARSTISAVGNGIGGIAININTSGNIEVCRSGTAIDFTFTANIKPFQWSYVSVIRSGTNMTAYLNGVSLGTQTNATSYNQSYLNIGYDGDGTSFPFVGYMASYQMIKGTAVVPPTGGPTSPLTSTAGTSILLNFTNAGVFDSAAVNDIETVGNAQVSTSVTRFGAPTIAFDGSGDYLVPNGAGTNLGFVFGTGNFTIEFWLYINSGLGSDIVLYDSRPLSTNGAYPTLYINSSSQLAYVVSGADRIVSGLTLTTATWYHVALARAGTSTRLFINGQQYGSTYSDSNNYLNPARRPVIGINGFNESAAPLNGYISNLRVTDGYARYWYNFPVPTAAFPVRYAPEVVPSTDPLFDYVTLLLPGNGTNGAQNNTFLDSSTNNFTITRNGNTTQGAFSPYGDNWSNYFGGSDYLSTSISNNIVPTTGDFTVETWIFQTGTSLGQNLFFFRGNTSAYSACRLVCESQQVQFLVSTNGSSWAISSGSVGSFQLNTWTHIAITRSGGTFTVYINGVSIYTSTAVSSGTALMTGSLNYVGSISTGSPVGGFIGYISNLRVVTSAVYTTNFTPPASPLTAITNTSFLTCQANRFLDSSTNNFTVTPNGSPSVQRFSPFHPTAPYAAGTIGGSGYFDGSGDYLSVADNAALQLTADFTIDLWVLIPASTGFNQVLVSKWNGSNQGYLLYFDVATSKVIFSNTATSLTPSATLTFGAWTHIAVLRSGNNYTLYLNGTSQATSTSASAATDSGTALEIGRNTANSTNYTAGYISNARIIKGSAVVPPAGGPTSPVTAVTNTSLLLNFTNGGIIDNAMMNDLETVGNAQISTSVSRFGGGSMYFNNTQSGSPTTTDYLLGSNNPQYNIGGGNFTIEFWLYPTTVSVANPYNQAFIVSKASYSSNQGWSIIQGNQTIILRIGDSGGTFTTSNALSANTWQHVAVVRNGTSVNIYVNGTSVASGTLNNFTDSSTVLNIGGAKSTTGWNGDYPFNGYIDDLRITKGIARYVQPFTPPTQAFQTS